MGLDYRHHDCHGPYPVADFSGDLRSESATRKASTHSASPGSDYGELQWLTGQSRESRSNSAAARSAFVLNVVAGNGKSKRRRKRKGGSRWPNHMTTVTVRSRSAMAKAAFAAMALSIRTSSNRGSRCLTIYGRSLPILTRARKPTINTSNPKPGRR